MEQNKDLIESYKLTTVRDRIGIYGQRLILRLVELATAEGATQGLDFKSGKDIRQVEVGLWGENTVTMPLSDITAETDNRSKPRKAVIALMQEISEAEDEDGDWFAFPFLTFAQVKNGMLTVKVRQELWQVFMDFRKGFRRFELEAALQLKSTYSLRLYKLVSEQHDTEYLDFQLDELKKMLGVSWTAWRRGHSHTPGSPPGSRPVDERPLSGSGSSPTTSPNTGIPTWPSSRHA